MNKRRLAETLFAFFLVASTAATAGEHADPAGFSFKYPDTWFAITSVNRDSLPPELKNWVARNRVDLTRVKVTVLRRANEEFLENLNVVVDTQQMPINNASLQKLLEIIPQQFRSVGVTIEDMQGRLGQFGANQAIILEYRSRLPGVPIPLKQRQVMLAGGGKTFIVTCTAKQDTFDQHVGTFDSILASFNVPAPIAQGVNLNPILRGALVGGIVGGLAAILAYFRRKKAKAAD